MWTPWRRSQCRAPGALNGWHSPGWYEALPCDHCGDQIDDPCRGHSEGGPCRCTGRIHDIDEATIRADIRECEAEMRQVYDVDTQHVAIRLRRELRRRARLLRAAEGRPQLVVP